MPDRELDDRPPLTEPTYQMLVADSLAERFDRIGSAIPDRAGNALDLGCNLGDISALCARRGLWTVGMDRSAEYVNAARHRHRNTPGCTFTVFDLAPRDLTRLPVFDVVLTLSVYHHWVMDYGYAAAVEMLRDATRLAGQVLIFESPSRRSRYGEHPPDFVDNDEVTVPAYLAAFLATELGDLASRIVALGKAGCVGEREPYRWCFAVHR